MTRRIYSLVAVLTAFGPDAGAHHAIDRVYDSDRQLSIEGTVTEFRFINPHPFLIIEVETASGETESWQLEMDNRFELSGIGMSDSTFKPGDHVIATGNVGRVAAQTIYLRRLDRPSDGLRYEQRGYSPSLSPGRP
jgi:hypothetical protein